VFDVFDRYHCAIEWFRPASEYLALGGFERTVPEICAELGRIADVKLEGHKALICMWRGHSWAKRISGRVFSRSGM